VLYIWGYLLLTSHIKMTRTEYLETMEGQSLDRFKRMIKTIYLEVAQEPKGKNSTDREKLYFRQEIKRQLKEWKRRPFRGDLIMEIDYFTTQKVPPALHTLSKNYLDLLHKPMPHIDSYKGLLFNDDSQIKILISNYHIDEFDKQRACIKIKAYSLGFFIKDIEFTDRIINNKFENSDYHRHSNFEDELLYERNHDNRDYVDDLLELERDKEFYDKTFGEQYFLLQKQFCTRQIQEQFLKINEFGIRNLISIFQPVFSYYKQYSADKSFQSIWGSSRNLIFFSSSFLDFGNAPQKKGESNIFKTNLKEELKKFKENFKILFPLLQPISVIITFIPPKQKVVDLDNLARYIAPFVNEIFEPPSTIQLTYDNKYQNELLRREVEITQQIPPNSIASYQLIHLPRQNNDHENGEIRFVITDGLYHMNNIWSTVNEFIDKWDKSN